MSSTDKDQIQFNTVLAIDPAYFKVASIIQCSRPIQPLLPRTARRFSQALPNWNGSSLQASFLSFRSSISIFLDKGSHLRRPVMVNNFNWQGDPLARNVTLFVSLNHVFGLNASEDLHTSHECSSTL